MSKIRWLLAALGMAVIGLVPVLAANSRDRQLSQGAGQSDGAAQAAAGGR